MLRAMSAWLHWGVDSQPDYTLKRKVLYTNVGALFTILSLLAYSPLLLSIGNNATSKVVIASISFCLPLSMTPWLNRKGWDGLARWNLVFCALASQAITIFMAFGSILNVHYYFILFAIIPVAFFPARQWPSIIFLFVLNVLLFLAARSGWIAPEPALQEQDGSIVRFLQGANIATSFLTMLFFIWLAEIIAERNEHKLGAMALTDTLTNLPNRRYFELAFHQEAAKSKRDHEPLSLAILDIDHFKRVNDKFGHNVGDDVLRHIAVHLQKSTRAGNLVARVGGEEFAVLLPNASLAAATSMAERIRQTIEAAGYVYKGQYLKITISAGVAAVDYEAPMEYSYKQADDALYSAKRSGRNRVVAHGEAVDLQHSLTM